MIRHTVEQHRLVHRGREFHFVAYEARPANERRGEEALPPTWFLMAAGKRWSVMPAVADQSDTERNRRFVQWLERHVFTGAPPA